MARRRATTERTARRAQRDTTSAAPRPKTASSAVWRDRAIVGGVALAASIAGIANGFVFDDVPQIVENARVQDLSRVGEIFSSAYWPPPFAPELFRPVASLSAALQYVVGGGEPLVFRVVSYALYALAAVVVYSLAARVLPRAIALGAGVLFAAHPLHVEAVALAVNQGELIVGCASVAAALLYLDRRRSGDLSRRDWIALCGLFVVAALSKENGFVLPGLLVAVELLLVERATVRERVRETWRGYACIGAAAAILLVARGVVLGGSVAGALPAKAIAGLSLGGRLLTTLQIVPQWLRLLVWPAHLQIDYSPNEIVASTGFGVWEALGLALVASFAAVAWWTRRRAPVIAFGLAWCAIALFPVSNIVPTGIVLAERTLFLPSVGFLLAVGGAADVLVRRWPSSLGIGRSLTVACSALVCLGIARSDARHRTWRNGQTMWEAAAIDAPRSLRVKQAHEEAIADITRDFERAATRSPTPWRVQFELATLLRYMRADSAALTQLRKSVASQPAQHDAALELSATLISVGEYQEAKAVAEEIRSVGDTARLAKAMARMADSASTVRAPPGSVRVVARDAFANPRRYGLEH
jgi:hypothetical protein